MIFYTDLKVPTGDLLLIKEDREITGVFWKSYKKVPKPEENWINDPSEFTDAIKQIQEYFDGKRKSFDIKIRAAGTDFQKAVWSVIAKIPYNQSLTYKQVAEKIGKPKAVRAVGTAVGSNPLCIVVPCQRVSTASGTISGYAGGIESKRYLLELERTYA